MKKISCLLVLCLCIFSLSARQTASLASPDGHLKIVASAGINPGSLLSYRFTVRGTTVIEKGTIVLQAGKGAEAGTWRLANVKRDAKNTSWKPIYGERALVPEQYRELRLYLSNATNRQQAVITFRLYNEGLAYRYLLKSVDGDTLQLNAERSEFGFTSNHTAWATRTAQGIIEAKAINDIGEASERPLTIKINPRLYIALGEAGLVDFARMKFVRTGVNTLGTVLHGPVNQYPEIRSPWRYVLTAGSPGGLLEKNYLLLNLNEPSRIRSTSWIRPGKVIRESSLTTAGSMLCIDFAARHRIAYVSFDAGWYGQEDSDTSDARRVMLDPARSKGPLDLAAVISYANSKNVGIILYVNRRALERQLDTLLPIYKRWGIKGIKFGFVQTGSQKWTSWVHEAVRKCAAYNMVVDIHDEYRPTGYERTYPNLLTQEGVRGDEESPDNAMVLKTLFTRMIAGPADQTNAYFTRRVDKMSSHASQMAKAICLYSPLQFIYWYDRPVATLPDPAPEGAIQNIADLEFYDNVPTVWSETKVIEGEIGEYATVARKSGKEWFVGSLAGKTGRKLQLDCSFLDKSKRYMAIIYADDAGSRSPTRVAISEIPVNQGSVLNLEIKANNGLAIRIVPLNK
ncbi:glycoside hydrolase family 97 protein [Pedobacter sp. SYP-B3415]|uniref:glycoside hydrolase family 97 protein n=1 Tax=Pedobacter sp. SYP-B3415 TaxID=2496641 RepID=UPI0013EA8CAE|nr:glycoside hydrolase family 97 protein [Pedobacter sp. SYP-B3415]